MPRHETHYNIYYPKKEVNIAETRLDNVLGVLWYTVKSLLLTDTVCQKYFFKI